LAPGDLTGILLVGGASRRFGSPKALAELDGETLAARAWRTLGKVCSERLALGKRQDGLGLPFEILDDESEVRAPIAGLVAGLRAASNDVCIALPVDMPFIRASHLRALATACADAAVPQTGPLPGAYRRSALPVLERRFASRELALSDALTDLDARVVDLEASALVNVNEPAELERLEPKLAGLPPEARTRVDEVTRLIVEKLLLTPTEQLKSVSDDAMIVAYADALNRLFSLAQDKDKDEGTVASEEESEVSS